MKNSKKTKKSNNVQAHAFHESRTIMSYLKTRRSISAGFGGLLLVLAATSVLYSQSVIHLPIVGKQDDTNPSASQKEYKIHLPMISNDTGHEVQPSPVSVDEGDWMPLESPEMSIRIRYPEHMNARLTYDGSIDLTFPKDYYRSIGISEVDRSDVKRAWFKPFRTYVKQLLSAYGSKNATNATISSFEGKGVSGYIVTGFEIGVHSRVYFEHNDKVYVASLGQGGGIGGKSPYGWPHEEEDVALFYQILDTIELLD